MITPEVFMDIISLHRQGLSMRAIAKKLGIHRNTVKRNIEGNRFPQYRKSKRHGSFYNEFLHFAHHYSFTTKACPPYSPWVKNYAFIMHLFRVIRQKLNMFVSFL